MENTRKSNLDFGTIAWGALFVLWGVMEMFKFLPVGTGAAGIGLILIAANLARAWQGQPVSGLTTTLGVLALVMGGLQLTQLFLHLSFELPIFAILLFTLGGILLGRSLLSSRPQG